ncbi:MAG TPA: hypothetical protein VMW06_09435, partial [Desulfobacterales bacterium]|nr:hypothetical protein [Desulfobacterales bacterium]
DPAGKTDRRNRAAARGEKRVARNDPEGVNIRFQGEGFGYPQRGFALLEFHSLVEIPNIKFQISNK